jgi:hypothetical protein
MTLDLSPLNQAEGQLAKSLAYAHSPAALDLGIFPQSLPLPTLAQLNHAFDTSDLTIKIDRVDWASAGLSFRDTIARDKVLIQSAVAPD